MEFIKIVIFGWRGGEVGSTVAVTVGEGKGVSVAVGEGVGVHVGWIPVDDLLVGVGVFVLMSPPTGKPTDSGVVDNKSWPKAIHETTMRTMISIPAIMVRCRCRFDWDFSEGCACRGGASNTSLVRIPGT
jgi:hypothetical protein